MTEPKVGDIIYTHYGQNGQQYGQGYGYVSKQATFKELGHFKGNCKLIITSIDENEISARVLVHPLLRRIGEYDRYSPYSFRNLLKRGQLWIDEEVNTEELQSFSSLDRFKDLEL